MGWHLVEPCHDATVNVDLVQLISEVGGAFAFGISAFVLLRHVLQDSRAEREKWLGYLAENSDRNLRAIYGLERALNDLKHVIEKQERK